MTTKHVPVVPMRDVVDIRVDFSLFAASFVPPALPDGPVNELFVRAGMCIGMCVFQFASLDFG